jgi:hypothetical protein
MIQTPYPHRWVLVRNLEAVFATGKGYLSYGVTDILEHEDEESFERRLKVKIIEMGRDGSDAEYDRLSNLAKNLDCVSEVMET